MLSVSIGFDARRADPVGPGVPRADRRARAPRGRAAGVVRVGIDTPQLANRVVAEEQLDLVMVGRAHLADPHWPYYAAKQLGVERPSWTLPAPYAHWLERYRSADKVA